MDIFGIQTRKLFNACKLASPEMAQEALSKGAHVNGFKKTGSFSELEYNGVFEMPYVCSRGSVLETPLAFALNFESREKDPLKRDNLSRIINLILEKPELDISCVVRKRHKIFHRRHFDNLDGRNEDFSLQELMSITKYNKTVRIKQHTRVRISNKMYTHLEKFLREKQKSLID